MYDRPGILYLQLNIYGSMLRNLKMLVVTCVTLTGIVFFAACQSGAGSVKEDDTTAALRILLDSAFYKDRLGAAPRLDPSWALKDTIIFKRNDILVRHMPKSIPHKFLTEDEMCGVMPADPPNSLQFLELDEFIKTTNGYRTEIGSHCMYKGIEQTEPDGISQSVCEREKYCNAVLHMDIIKRGDNLTGSRFILMTY